MSAALIILMCPAWALCFQEGPAYESLRQVSSNPADPDTAARNFDGASLRDGTESMIPPEGRVADAAQPRRLNRFEAGAGRGWKAGMRFVDAYDQKMIEPVLDSYHRYTGRSPKPSLPARAAATVGMYLYAWPNLLVVVLGFVASSVMALAGGVAGLFSGSKKAGDSIPD